MENNKRHDWFEERGNLKTIILSFIAMGIMGMYSCQKDYPTPMPEPYVQKLPNFFPPMPVPASNPFTTAGIELGRHLFYEPMLSGDNTQACASCHHQSEAFADTSRFSIGIDGFKTSRTAMPIANLAYSPRLFWDGKATSLEQLVLFPIQSQVEMHEDLFNAVQELQESHKYPKMFYEAFGSSIITTENMTKSLAQFMRTMISYSNKMAPGGVGVQSRSKVEELGFQVFLDEKKGDCFHCHAVNIFSTNFEMVNNGLLDENAPDLGLMGQTGNPADKHKFKTPSLINLKYTAPYMHDGRFSTLEQVLDFYDTGFHVSNTLDVNLLKHTKDGKPVPRSWTDLEKIYLIKFLEGLTDDQFLTDPKFSKP